MSLPIRPRSLRAVAHAGRAAALALLALLCGVGRAGASVPGGGAGAAAPGVSIAMISAPQLTLDSNKPCQEGPSAAYVAFRVTNTSGAPLTNLRATISGFANGIVLGGGQAQQQYIGGMAAGAWKVLYWFVQYPCGSFGNTANLTVSVTDATGTTTGSGTVTTSSMVSAQAGGVLISGTLGPGAVVGQVIEFDVQYEFGGVSAGDSYNLQVAGNPAFNAGCFQLVKMQVVASDVPAAPVGDLDRPFFTAAAAQGGSKHPLTVRYYFKYLCANVSSTARPYSNQFSGGQLKYSSNYETFVGPTLPIATNPFTVSKSASPRTMAAGGPVTYTVTISNPSSFPAEMDSIVDQLPVGMTYGGLAAGSGVTTANSGSAPATGATGTLVWRGIPGQSYALPANGSLTLVYTASVSAVGEYVNTVRAFTGATLLSSDADTVSVGTINVTPKGVATPLPKLPGKHSQVFTVNHGFNGSRSYDLLARITGTAATPGVFITVDSLRGAGITAPQARPDSARVTLGALTSYSVTVWYTVPVGDTAVNVEFLRARAASDTTRRSEGWVDVRRVFPSLTLAKQVTPTGTLSPGTELTYTLAFSNVGEYAAEGVIVADSVPPQVLFKPGSPGQTLPAGITATVEYSSDSGATWSYTPVSGGCGAPTGYDGCVRRLRWVLTGSLPAGAAASSGTVEFKARIQ